MFTFNLPGLSGLSKRSVESVRQTKTGFRILKKLRATSKFSNKGPALTLIQNRLRRSASQNLTREKD